jgi:hypothetical protein
VLHVATSEGSPAAGFLYMNYAFDEVLHGNFEQGFQDIAIVGAHNLVTGAFALTTGGDLPTGGVYTLRNPDGLVVRVGRTSDLARRAGEYGRDPNYFDLDFMPEFETNNYSAQRGLEQMLYDEYNPPMNVNRPISLRNSNITNYINVAYHFLLTFFGVSR